MFLKMSPKLTQEVDAYLSVGTSWRPPPDLPGAVETWGPGPVPQRRQPGPRRVYRDTAEPLLHGNTPANRKG